jgi:hypothetical protein
MEGVCFPASHRQSVAGLTFSSSAAALSVKPASIRALFAPCTVTTSLFMRHKIFARVAVTRINSTLQA